MPNYYIGLFTCIFVFLLFFVYEFCRWGGWKKFFADLLRIACFSALAIGMTAVLVPDYEVQSNREAGKGRFDVAVFPKDARKPGLLFEFKTAASEAELAAKVDEALQQMAERDYLAPFRAREIQQVHQYGVAFCGKQVVLKKMPI